jgi:sulfide dehydrogenase cytochrome subunit
MQPVLTAAMAALAVAATPPPGASACSGCHGPTGPVADLRGRAASETAAAMQRFRDGTRRATVMDRIAKGFTDDEVRAIAAWLAAQRAATP